MLAVMSMTHKRILGVFEGQGKMGEGEMRVPSSIISVRVNNTSQRLIRNCPQHTLQMRKDVISACCGDAFKPHTTCTCCFIFVLECRLTHGRERDRRRQSRRKRQREKYTFPFSKDAYRRCAVLLLLLHF